MEINHLPDKEFKVMVMKVITDLDRRINRKLQQRDGKKKKEPDIKNTTTEGNNTVEKINSQLEVAEEWNNLEDKVVEIIQPESKNIFFEKVGLVLGVSRTTSSILKFTL